ncbi:hypothetical protein SAMD00023353_7100210 [Rosellinia necatrix]|uniref:Uncharacterized protein n=1 Tax=Rosellinia necatrix TaxID=77044 RepID=A0A1S8AAL4_ROSNE|nr:hypothetical protein SAMD00023353_7100210 [Rosellinia necatrix]
MSSDTTPLLAPSSGEQAPQGDSHPITLRACHSPWRIINPKLLFSIRTILASYLTSVAGVALKYKLEREDDHSGWRVPFQFSTVAFVMQWAYHLLALAWTGVHTFEPNIPEPDENSEAAQAQARITRFFSPPHHVTSMEHFSFSMFYTVSHVFTLLNTLLYWVVLVPAGHGGLQFPKFPHHHHKMGNNTGIFYDPNKRSIEEEDIKPFSIINIWTITTVIAFIEMVFLNSIRRQSPVVGHVAGTMVASGLYLAWAGIGKLATDHWGLFFLDPKLMGNSTRAAVAAAAGFVVASPFVLTYIYGLIAMRESITAAH